MKWLSKLIRPDLQGIVAYKSARCEGGAYLPDIRIDANEFPWPPFGFASEKCALNRYPEPQPKELLQRLSAYWNIASDNMLLARGSDEGIDVLIRLFCRAGKDQILICPPTYGMYKIAAAIQQADVLQVPLKRNGQVNLSGILAGCTPRTKLIFIPSPNAPMGHVMRRQDILALCKERSKRSLVVIDEAYVEFSETPEGMLAALDKVPNLVVLRTLSKAHALAGERIGVVLAAIEIINGLAKIIAPYPLTQTSIRSALDALSTNGLVHNNQLRRDVISERRRMARLLSKSPLIKRVYPSSANFLLAEVTNSSEVMQRLKSFGILARNRSSEIPDTVRFSIGTPEENDFVAQALAVPIKKREIKRPRRLFSIQRTTKETNIDVTVDLDSPGFLHINSGIGFFDHMLKQLAQHGGFGLALMCKGDLHVDTHHSIEDCALGLGEALGKALGNKRGIARYGFTAPMDEALAQIVIDLSGRPYFELEGKFPAAPTTDVPDEMITHFFQSLANALKASIHVKLQGTNSHHVREAVFKAAGQALRQAMKREGDTLLSTKGIL